ncbi:MAG: hypothetical protein ABSH05_02745 [Bryobacteraceae bacterium]|jgi:hypothetical protein
MNRASALLLALALLICCAPVRAAENPVVGSWRVVSFGAEGLTWTLTVKQHDGKLSGTLKGDRGEFPLIDPKLDGNKFTFKVSVDDKIYSAEGKISGKSVEGVYKGPDDEGTFKGDKQS